MHVIVYWYRRNCYNPDGQGQVEFCTSRITEYVWSNVCVCVCVCVCVFVCVESERQGESEKSS